MFRVRYVCECGNIAGTPIITGRSKTHPGMYTSCYIINHNSDFICGECGNIMESEVIKRTQETKTEFIRKGTKNGTN